MTCIRVLIDREKKWKTNYRASDFVSLTSNSRATKGGALKIDIMCVWSVLYHSEWSAVYLQLFSLQIREKEAGVQEMEAVALLLSAILQTCWQFIFADCEVATWTNPAVNAAWAEPLWTRARSIITACCVYAAQTIVGLPFLQPLKGYFIISQVGMFGVFVSSTCIGHWGCWSGRDCTDGHSCLTQFSEL